MRNTVVCIIIIAMPVSMNCQTNIWQGNIGFWHEATNWSLGHIPLSHEDVLIAQSGAEVSIKDGETTTVRSINLQQKLTVGINSILNVDGSGSGQAGIVITNSGKIISFGLVRILNTSGPGISLTSGTFVNYATLTISDGSDMGILVTTNGNLDNLSTIEVLRMSGNQADGIRNFGVILNNGSIEINDIDQAKGCYNTGTLTNEQTIVIENTTYEGLHNSLSDGLLQNNGTITLKSTTLARSV